MEDKLTLSGEWSESLGCAPGDEVTIEVKVTIQQCDENGVVANVSEANVVAEEEMEAEPEEEPEMEEEAPPAKGNRPVPAAVIAVVSGQKGKK